jgi:hypothetical protein
MSQTHRALVRWEWLRACAHYLVRRARGNCSQRFFFRRARSSFLKRDQDVYSKRFLRLICRVRWFPLVGVSVELRKRRHVETVVGLLMIGPQSMLDFILCWVALGRTLFRCRSDHGTSSSFDDGDGHIEVSLHNEIVEMNVPMVGFAE